ncbi:MAG: site-specific integrase [Firmicutes bacterium]|nr:site-specific integrase [Bacillota bacterium]
MKINKIFDDYYDRTIALKSTATQMYERNLIRVNKKCLDYLGISKVNSIKLQTGYKMVRFYKEIMHASNNSINKYIWYLKSVLKYQDIHTSFYDFKKLQDDTKPFKRIYHEDLKLIVQYVKDMNFSKNSLVYRTMVFLLLDSGIRITELLNVKIKNIDFIRERILLEHTKNRKQRNAPFSQFSKNSIQEMIKTNPNREYLFWNLIQDRPLTKNDIKLFYRRLNNWLRLDTKIHSHRFRKTFASILRDNNARLEAIQHLLGHAKLTTTMNYIDQSDEMIKGEYNNHNSWGV